MSRLWYDHPASEWEEALPIGNGRIGAMVYGDRKSTRLNSSHSRKSRMPSSA